MENVYFSGIKELSLYERFRLENLTSKYYDKIKRLIKNELALKIHVKIHKSEGNRKKYSIHILGVAPTKTLVSTKGIGWNIEEASHKAFLDIENLIQHRLKTEGKRKIQKPSLVKNKVPSSKKK